VTSVPRRTKRGDRSGARQRYRLGDQTLGMELQVWRDGEADPRGEGPGGDTWWS
jgi:hypothetical protein